MFDKIKHKKEHKQAITYLNKINLAELVKYAERIWSYCIDEKTDYGYFHHLPLKDESGLYVLENNWNLPEKAVAEINRIQKELNRYYEAVFTVAHYDKSGVKKERGISIEILPYWIVFPLIPYGSIHWHMGAEEEYGFIWYHYINSLTIEQLEKYVLKYPVPEYMKAFNKNGALPDEYDLCREHLLKKV